MNTVKRELPILPLLIAAVVGVTTVYFVLSAMAGYPAYRAQHLGTALHYARHGFDPLRPVILGFNATQTPTVLEFPLWQLVAGAFLRLGQERLVMGNIASLLLFLTSLWPMHKLGAGLVDRRAANWVLAAYVCQPLVFSYAGSSAVDGTVLAAHVWASFACVRALQTRRVAAWALLAALAALLAVLKVPYFIAFGTGAGLFLLSQPDMRRCAGPWLRLGSAGVIGMGVFWVWAAHATACADEALFPLCAFRMSAKGSGMLNSMAHWRILASPFDLARGGLRFLRACTGSYALIFAVLAAAVSKASRPAAAFLLGAVAATLLFPRLVLVHHHYYLLYALPVALLLGAFLHRLEHALCEFAQWPRLVVRVVLCGVLAISLVQGLLARETFQFDPYSQDCARIIREHTSPRDKIIVQREHADWGGEHFFLSGRTGLSTMDFAALTSDPEAMQKLVSLGYTTLVLMSESPLYHAYKVVNPGPAAARRKRKSYREFDLSPVDSWPVVFQNEDMLILRIPAAAAPADAGNPA